MPKKTPNPPKKKTLAKTPKKTLWPTGGNGKWSGRRSENRKPRRMVRVEEEEEKMEVDPYEKLAEAIGRFAGVYARVEEAKQMVELEKQRMRFTKDLELQRIKLLMESQVQLEKLQHLKTNSEAGLWPAGFAGHLKISICQRNQLKILWFIKATYHFHQEQIF